VALYGYARTVMIMEVPSSELRILTDDEYIERIARAIHNVSGRRNTSLIQGWKTLSDETRTFFLEVADHVGRVLDQRRHQNRGRL
jgi:hypothetical protein